MTETHSKEMLCRILFLSLITLASTQTIAECEATQTQAECSSIGCYYNESRINDSLPNSPCMPRTIIEPKYGNATVEDPWCKNHFPFEVTVSLYFVNCFTVGFGLMGLWYNTYHYDVRAKIDLKTKKRFRNRLHGSQHIFIWWCLSFVVSGVLMITTAMVYLMSPTLCYWVYCSYLYFVICLAFLCFFGWRLLDSQIQTIALRRRQEKFDKKRLAGMFDGMIAQKPGTGLRYL